MTVNSTYDYGNNYLSNDNSKSYVLNSDDKKKNSTFDYTDDINFYENKIEGFRHKMDNYLENISLFSDNISENYNLMEEYKKSGDKEQYDIAYKNYWSNRFSKTFAYNGIMTCCSSIQNCIENISYYTRMESFNRLIEKYLS